MTPRLLARAPLLLLLLLLVFTLSSCAPRAAKLEAGAPPPSAPAAPQAAAKLAAVESADAVSGGSADGTATTGTAATSVSVGQRRLITTGDMTIEVISLDKALAALTNLVSANGGFFADKNVSAEGNWRSANLTIRVPAAKFEALHDGARGLGTVKREEQKGDDVTKQWQDLETRLKIRKQEEQSLLQLMQKQARLSDLLQVEQRLWQVREQIEQSEGELRYLRDQVTLATLTLTLNEQVPVGVEKIGRWNLGYHVLQALYALGRMLRGFVIGLIYVALPGAIVWLPLLLIILWLRRRLLRRREERRSIPPPPA